MADLIERHNKYIRLLEQGRAPRGNVGAGETHNPALERFVKLGPKSFFGDSDPKKAEVWLDQMTKIFTALNCSDIDRVNFAAFKLEGEAEHWYRVVKAKWATDSVEPTWAEFEKEFLAKYVPSSVRAKRELEFLNLTQGKMTVAQYENQFTQLSRHNPHLTPTDEMKAQRFIRGLNDELGFRLVALGKISYSEAVDRALNMEHEDSYRKSKRDLGSRRDFFSFSASSKDKKSGSFSRGHSGKERKGAKGKSSKSGNTSRDSYSQDSLVCKYCDRPGHREEQCRKRLGQCFLCGESSHMASECPRRDQRQSSSRGSAPSGYKRDNSGRQKVQGRIFALGQKEAADSTAVVGGSVGSANPGDNIRINS